MRFSRDAGFLEPEPPRGTIISWTSWNRPGLCGTIVDQRPRVLLIGNIPFSLGGGAEAVHCSTEPTDVAGHLQDGDIRAVVAAPDVVSNLFDQVGRNELILSHVDMGLAILGTSGAIVWANPAFLECCDADPVGQTMLAALGGDITPSTAGSGEFMVHPLLAAASGRHASFTLHRPKRLEKAHIAVNLCPVFDSTGAVTRIVVLVRDVTAEVTQQQKLDALHTAGRELAGLDVEGIDEMNLPSRVELLKQNLRRIVRNLLHYETIEIRILDRKTGELKLLLEDGMTKEAAGRALYAAPTGNGVTGYVAFTGKSYLCEDTACDPHYIEGAKGAHSSLTVPLKFQDEVIGTLNVESSKGNAFGPDELQFTELFSKEIADALHTLDLLTAQLACTASQSIEEVNKAIALPIDDVLASASLLLGRHPSSEAAVHLRRIIDKAREVKESVAKVGREIALLPASDGRCLAAKRVLVVDTDERMRKNAHSLIGRLGGKVETAASAGEGLALVADNPYDAILLDIKPGDMRGSEAYRRFRAASPAASIALTTGFGYDNDHTIVKARQEGLRHVIFKPFKPDQVTKAVLDGPPGQPVEAAFRSEVPAHS